MHNLRNVKTAAAFPVPATMRAWILGGPDELTLVEKPAPVPAKAEVLVRVDAIAICATDLAIIRCGSSARVQDDPASGNFTPGHEYMGTVAALGPGVDTFNIGERVAVAVHPGCGRCASCRQGTYDTCISNGQACNDANKRDRENAFAMHGGFADYAVNNIRTLIRVPDQMSDEEATLVVTAGAATYGLTKPGGLLTGKSVVVIGPGPIGLLAVAVAKALGGNPIVLAGARGDGHRLAIGRQLGADHLIDTSREPATEAVLRLTGGFGADYVLETTGAQVAISEATRMVSRGGKICLAASPDGPVLVDIPGIVRNKIHVFGIHGEGTGAAQRAVTLMAGKRFDATKIHTHTFALTELPLALRYAGERIEDAIKVVAKTHGGNRLARTPADGGVTSATSAS